MIQRLSLVLILLFAPVAGLANADLARLIDLIEVDTYITIAREEGLGEVESLSEDMLGQGASAVFQDQMARIYDAERMKDSVYAALETGLSQAEIEAALAFFATDQGARIIELEVAARRAMLSEEIEDAAERAWIVAEEESPWLVARIREISTATDLVEQNVSGALNSNLRFYQGLADGGALQLSEDEMLAEIWGQEETIRLDVDLWLNAYLLLAYQPLSETDITDYQAFWNSAAGQALNLAVFGGFNQMYEDLSYATGRVIALNMTTQDL